MVGTVHPRHRPRPTESHGEMAVWRALSTGLPDGWHAFHSLRLRAGPAHEGEGDFVVAKPDHGLLVVEVKGGRIEQHDGIWLQNGRPLKKAPREQAQRYVRLLLRALETRCGQRVPFGVAACFPDTAFSTGPSDGDLHGIVIGELDLPHLGELLPRIFDAVVPRGNAPRDAAAWIEALRQLWGDTWVPRVGLADRVQSAEERVLALNEAQQRLLDLVEKNPRALVEGGAGTGKTIVARELCQRRAWSGVPVVYLCFTDALAHWVDRGLEPLRAQGLDVRASTVRKLALELAQGEGSLGEGDPTKNEYWLEALANATKKLGPSQAKGPSLLVVDEAQDLAAEDWAFVRAYAGDADLWVFRDPRQGFWGEREVPPNLLEGMTRLDLPKQQRMPPAVDALAQAYAGLRSASDLHGVLDPHVVRVVEVAGGDVVAAVEAELARLQEQQIDANDIAVVSLVGQSASRLLGSERLARAGLVRADDPKAPDHTVLDTFLRFKGLERPIIIIAEPGHDATHWQYDVRFHVALTRATAGVVVLASPEAIAKDPRLSVARDVPGTDG